MTKLSFYTKPRFEIFVIPPKESFLIINENQIRSKFFIIANIKVLTTLSEIVGGIKKVIIKSGIKLICILYRAKYEFIPLSRSALFLKVVRLLYIGR